MSSGLRSRLAVRQDQCRDEQGEGEGEVTHREDRRALLSKLWVEGYFWVRREL
jgi:hypothetical protein